MTNTKKKGQKTLLRHNLRVISSFCATFDARK